MKTKIIVLAAVTCALMATSFDAEDQRKRYRWVDKEGVVHYGDRIPPEYAQQQIDVVSDQGITIGTRDAPLTDEEFAEQEQMKLEQEAANRAAEAQALRDRMLLDTYLSVTDLEEARDRRIGGLQAQIRLSRASIESLEASFEQLNEEAERHTSGGNEVPADLAGRLRNTNSQLEATRRFVETREREIADMEAQFEADITRFTQLRGTNRR